MSKVVEEEAVSEPQQIENTIDPTILKTVEHKRNRNQIIASRATVIAAVAAVFTCITAIIGFMELGKQREVENKLLILKELTPNVTIHSSDHLVGEDGNPTIKLELSNNSAFSVNYMLFPAVSSWSCRTSQPLRASSFSAEEIVGNRQKIITASPGERMPVSYFMNLLGNDDLLEEFKKEGDPAFFIFRVVTYMDRANDFREFIEEHDLTSPPLFADDSPNPNPLIHNPWNFYFAFEWLDGEVRRVGTPRCSEAIENVRTRFQQR